MENENSNSRIEAVHNGWYDAIHNGYRYGFLIKEYAQMFIDEVSSGKYSDEELRMSFWRAKESKPFSESTKG